MELDIPAYLKIYNEYAISQSPDALEPLLQYPADRQPRACVGCGQCADHCPQHIDIPRFMLRLSAAIQNSPPVP